MVVNSNRFDFLRLTFAFIVFVYHAVVLSTFMSSREEVILSRFAELSIQGFFIISGMLVYGSLTRSKSIPDYAAKRVRRLYPAYIVVILIPAFVSLSLGGAVEQIGKYITANLLFLNFLQPTLPGLFEGHRFPVVNGALWTLKIEVMFYIALPVLGWVLTKAGQAKWGLLVLIYIAAEIWRGVIPHMNISHAAQIARQLPGQMGFFVVGMALWMLKDKLLTRIGVVGILGIVLLTVSFLPFLEFLRAVGLGGIVFVMAYGPGPQLNAARFGDLSYGVYITHFPIINGLIAAGLFANAPWQAMMITVIIVFIASLLMWHIVEKPALRNNSYYRTSERTKR